MVGIPCSGKTTTAKIIAEYLEKTLNKPVHLLNEEALLLDKATYYADNNQEKILRASLKSNVEKYLSSESIVILDSLNYIKGYRYEMYCLARSAMSTLAVVWCDCPVDIAKGRLGEGNFPESMFDDYASRLEHPNGTKRWDQPLF